MEMKIINKDVLDKAIKKYGVEKQLLVCMEEPAELIQAISKAERYPEDSTRMQDLIEEMADVTICLEYLKLIYNIRQEELDEWINRKVKRISKKIKEL
jgi:NTP pyrophosphatase (non-canonical NTP hydrolase)